MWRKFFCSKVCHQQKKVKKHCLIERCHLKRNFYLTICDLYCQITDDRTEEDWKNLIISVTKDLHSISITWQNTHPPHDRLGDAEPNGGILPRCRNSGSRNRLWNNDIQVNYKPPTISMTSFSFSYSYNTFWLWTNTGMIYRFNQSDKNWAKWDAVTCAQGPRQWSRAMPSRNRSGCRWTGRIPSRARRQWEAISCQKSVLCRIFFMINKSLFKWDKLSSK